MSSKIGWVMASLLALTTTASAGDRVLRAELEVDAAVEEVWAAWATEAGVTTFFAPAARIEPRVDGLYEIYFHPLAEHGRRGAEDLRILAYEPPRRLSFTWSAPVDQPYVRAQRTVVTIELTPSARGRTRLLFTHSGWGEGPDWDRAYEYFDGAWNRAVLPRLVHRFRDGPIDWEKRPDLTPVRASLRAELEPAPRD